VRRGNPGIAAYDQGIEWAKPYGSVEVVNACFSIVEVDP
jgi:hypothetical protein